MATQERPTIGCKLPFWVPLGGSEMSQWGDRTKDAQGGSAQDPEYAESGGAVDFRAGEGPGLISGDAGPPREDAEQGRDVVRGVF